MLLSEPQPSEYDWRFRIFGFPVRVTWLFWAVSAALGYNSALAIRAIYEFQGVTVNLGSILAVWVAATFISILVHELGHALAFRYFGIQAEIVLYQMGGLAIPGAGFLWGRQGRRTRLTYVDQIIISAAGPVLQLLLALGVGVTAIFCGIFVYEFNWLANGLGLITMRPSQPLLYALIHFLVTTSIWWALLNLLPIYPLDGGRISQQILGMIRRTDGLLEINAVSIVVCVAGAYWMFQQQESMYAIYLAMFAVINFQSLQSQSGYRF